MDWGYIRNILLAALGKMVFNSFELHRSWTKAIITKAGMLFRFAGYSNSSFEDLAHFKGHLENICQLFGFQKLDFAQRELAIEKWIIEGIVAADALIKLYAMLATMGYVATYLLSLSQYPRDPFRQTQAIRISKKEDGISSQNKELRLRSDNARSGVMGVGVGWLPPF